MSDAGNAYDGIDTSGFRIVAPHFVAGASIRRDKVTRAAPIIRYMTGWPMSMVVDYCKKKDWAIEID